ncbi:UDP-N-acetylmuramoyl-L-alanyl-D-glutamate--2,6-diaminopimelate ligase [Halobacillus sp. A5]|uniref:UDP-N-acetylmuramoyl-L-alanyl-D-glutamate--2, 6-diaminopimelate ligase n=1 Tax=Halobacillus sp. A5 TaxID=2880263 RepID=UPI0020A65474|nr:UDP-N-acetylmuramoyl-L-alanyl-D-glutamate--2,6-diaminopimelate ligase [Halobacillus sp. A5]MCP3029403.1 UDP-N-acetylmuramoyl-L-alanyl-D-glutamate--2,6-diaminopimelate ligase [Halobacillus sp. A5]
MELKQLLDQLLFDCHHPLTNIRINGITDASTEVEPGYIFVAIKGYQSDGHDYIKDAISRGAAAVIGENDEPGISIPYIKVVNSKKALGIVSAAFYRDPSQRKLMIGITGTNGKTTTSYLVKHILEEIGYSCSLIGTIQNIVNGEKTTTQNTTPNALKINQLLSQSNDDVVIMEASSQGLAEFRLEGISFDICLFTNLSHEHLNYHGTLDQYFEAKSMLFSKLKPQGTAVINADDHYGEKLSNRLRNKDLSVVTFGENPDAVIQMTDFKLSYPYSVRLNEGIQSCNVTSPIPGYHNLFNVAIAYACAKVLHASPNAICEAIERFPGVEGRFNMIDFPNGATVVIDHAHTPDAIINCLQTSYESKSGSLYHVFGFKGDKDTEKRKEMVRISAEMSDYYILTLDNLNSVPKEQMIQTLYDLQDNYGNAKGEIVNDRTLAIEKALSLSKEGDWIVISGKGHQTYQHEYQHPASSDKETVLLLKERAPEK